jgi:RNA polymerase sigma-70 factor (ECF subfamily)
MAVILRDVEGFSTAEVAEILGSSEGTVRSQICRGRLRLKEAMDSKTGERS